MNKKLSTKLILIAFILMPLLMISKYAFAGYWSPMASPTAYDLRGVWGSSGSDVFAVGHTNDHSDGIILHYDGDIWLSIDNDTKLSSVWGSSNSDIFAVGGTNPCALVGGMCPYNTILHNNGDEWLSMESVTTSPLRGVWGSSGSDVFVVGYYGTILHYNGSSWSSMNSGVEYNLYGVWGSSGSDVHVVGNNDGSILHYDGSSWSETYGGTGQTFSDIWGSSGSDIFAAGGVWGLPGTGTILHYNGSVWTPMDIGTVAYINDIWGTSDTDVFAVGNDGTILYYDGNVAGTWFPMNSRTSEYLFGVWANSESDVFATGYNGTILHYSPCVDDAECSFLDDQCNLGVCNTSTGDCEQDTTSKNGYVCDDGLYCNGDDTCDGGSCSLHSGSPPCDPDYCCDEVNGVCLDNTGDDDCDGVLDDGGASSCTTGQTESCDDNCYQTANGPLQGVCAKQINPNLVQIIGDLCSDDLDCASGAFCEINQLDSNDNGIGDACECEADFNCSGGVDGVDLLVFIEDWLRGPLNNPCIPENPPCEGDFDGSGSVDGVDLIKFIEDWLRGPLDRPCPSCP